MAQSINLVPHHEIVEQKTKKVVKMSSVFAVVLFVIVGVVAGYFFYVTQSIKSQISSVENEIETHRTNITSLSEMEVLARTLDTRYQVANSVFEKRRTYSVLLQELQKRVPSNVSISSFSIGGDAQNVISLSGTGQNYLAVAQFLNTLSDAQFSDTSEELKPLFSDVSLNSVTLDSQNLTVSYFIVVKFNEGLLK